jgi:hypothetical protein
MEDPPFAVDRDGGEDELMASDEVRVGIHDRRHPVSSVDRP